jgi:hypothetical protein
MSVWRSVGVRRAVVTVVAVVTCLAWPTVAHAAPSAPAPVVADEPTAVEPPEGPAKGPDDVAVEPEEIRAAPEQEPCAKTAIEVENAASSCMRGMTAQELRDAKLATDGETPAALRPFPSWCSDRRDGEARAQSRTQACLTAGLKLTLTRRRGGADVTTGELSIAIVGLVTTALRSGMISHQFKAYSIDGFGDALVGTQLAARPARSGACRLSVDGSKTEPIVPFYRQMTSDSEFTTTVTSAGAVGSCRTGWRFHFQTPSYPDSNAHAISVTQVRCDIPRSGSGIGCVVPWYAEILHYRDSRVPTIARHVTEAQRSGLPGATLSNPLTYTSDDAIQRRNRALACGDAPSTPTVWCDEYPPAITRNGLTGGGTRRSPGAWCQFPGVNPGRGPTGVSVCMVPASEQRSQGGSHAAFIIAQHILDGDRFRIGIVYDV